MADRNGKVQKARIHVAHTDAHLQCTTYLIEGPQGAVLVDPGSGTIETELLANARSLGCGPERIRAALLTHCHVDHALGAYRLQKIGIQLVASARTAEIMRAGGRQVWYEYPEYVIPTEIDRVCGDGEELVLCGLQIRVMLTPGHTPDSASFLVESDKGLSVFTGDLINHRGEPGWAGSEGYSADETMASIRKLMDAAPDRAYWGHGVVGSSALEWLKNALEQGRTGKWRPDRQLHPQYRPPDYFEKAAR